MSGMPHEEAKAYLDSYLANKSDQGTAVLIDGHWGAGKTEFVVNYFKGRKARISRSRGKDQSPDYLYASFFGVSDESAISDQFLSQLYPTLNSKLGKILGTAAFRIGSSLFEKTWRLKGIFQSSDVEAARRWIAEPRERIVVFDDLERVDFGFGFERALAIINGYVERDGIRAIVIANESEIQSDKYTAWKEKVIGKSLLICADADEVVESIARDLPSGSVKRYLVDNIAKVASVVRASTYPNYRSVKNLIADANRMVVGADARLGGCRPAVESLILYSVGIGAEFRAGKLSADEVLDRVRMRFVVAKNSDDARALAVRDIFSKYANVGASECMIPAEYLVALWSSGELKTEDINRSVLKNPRVVGDDATPAWRRLWSMWELGQSSYERARNDALELLERNAVTIEGELLHIVGAALQVEEYGGEFFPKEKTLDWLRSYLGRDEVRSRLCGTSIYHRGVSNTAYEGLGYTGGALPAFADAQMLVTRALRELDEERKRERLEDYLERLRQGDYESISLSRNWVEGIPFGSWLHLVEPADFVAILVSDGRIVSGLGRRVIARYESDGMADLREEWVWLRQVRRLCWAAVVRLDQPHRMISRSLLARARSDIFVAIKMARKQKRMSSCGL